MFQFAINNCTKIVCVVLLLASTACSGGSSDNGSSQHHFVLRWNQAAIDSSGIDHESTSAGENLGPTKSSRAMAIVHIAILESFNAITPRYASYIGIEPAQPLASGELLSPEIALSKAARDTLAYLYPSQTPSFDQLFSQEVALVENVSQEQFDASVQLGARVAARVIEMRRSDRSDLSTDLNESLYEFSELPGRWRRDPFNPAQLPLGTQWSLVTPFVLQSSSQFRAPPPPALDSAEYAEAYAEVFRLGGDGVQTPTERTPEQTEIGIFWAYDGTPSLCAPPRLYNQIVRKILDRYGPEDALETARIFALVNIAMADTAISIWEAKFFYDLWRPVTAIQESDPGTGPSGIGDGNILTPGDINFKPLGAPASNTFENNFTPPFPSYPSGHGGFGAALFEILRNYYGTDDLSFSFISDEFNGQTLGTDGSPRPVVERFYNNFSEAEEENGQSRIYLGIHFSFDKTSSILQGRKVATHVFNNIYPPL